MIERFSASLLAMQCNGDVMVVLFVALFRGINQD
jgi:hypothetical protein